MKTLKFRIWLIQQTILQREENVSRCKDPEHINLILSNIEKDKIRLNHLLEQLKEV